MKRFFIFIAILLSFSLCVSAFSSKSDISFEGDEEETDSGNITDDESDSDRVLIRFSVDQLHYRCVEGSTWRQLLEESLLIPHGVCEKDGYVGTNNEGKYLFLFTSENTGVFPRFDDPIVSGGRYIEVSGPVYEDGLGVFYLDSEPYSFPIGFSWREFVNGGFYDEFMLNVDYGAVGYRVSEDDLRMITFNGDIFDSSSLIAVGAKYALSEDSIS